MKPIILKVTPDGGRVEECLDGMISLARQLDCGIESTINDVDMLVYPYSDLYEMYQLYLKEYKKNKEVTIGG